MRPRQTTPADGEIGKRIRAARMVAKMSQSHLAEAIGVTFQQVQKYEKGVNRVGAVRLQDIASALKIDVSMLLGVDVGSPETNYMAEFFATPYAADVARMFMDMQPSNRLVIRDLMSGLSKTMPSAPISAERGA